MSTAELSVRFHSFVFDSNFCYSSSGIGDLTTLYKYFHFRQENPCGSLLAQLCFISNDPNSSSLACWMDVYHTSWAPSIYHTYHTKSMDELCFCFFDIFFPSVLIPSWFYKATEARVHSNFWRKRGFPFCNKGMHSGRIAITKSWRNGEKTSRLWIVALQQR